MKHKLITLTLALLSFGLGWWANNIQIFTNSITEDTQQVDSLKMNHILLDDSLKIKESKTTKKKTIHDYISDSQFIHWTPNHSDKTGFMCEITLHKKTALYWYHGQCGYDYFTYSTSDTTIDVLWSYRPDCILSMDFLEKSNGIKKYPKRGDNFATLTLVNDTTLKVKYNFPEWTKKVNEITKDSLFPIYYYLQHDN